MDVVLLVCRCWLNPCELVLFCQECVVSGLCGGVLGGVVLTHCSPPVYHTPHASIMSPTTSIRTRRGVVTQRHNTHSENFFFLRTSFYMVGRKSPGKFSQSPRGKSPPERETRNTFLTLVPQRSSTSLLILCHGC